jgi:hypothetical protein
MAGTAVRAAAGGCDDALWQRSPRLLGEYSKRRVAALVEMAWMVTGGGLYTRSVEFPDFSARYDAPGSIAGQRRGVRVRAVQSVLATQCAVLESKADMQKRGQASPDDGDALALTFSQRVAPAEVEEVDEEEHR